MALTQKQISQLYVAIFNRASEGAGNAYWQDKGVTASIANEMLATKDAQVYFGSSLDSSQAFIEHIYLNTLNKTVAQDAAGIAYWVGLLDNGATRGDVVASLVQAIENYAPGAIYYNASDTATVAAYNQFANRVAVSDYMAQNVFDTPGDYKTSTSFSDALNVNNNSATKVGAMNTIANTFATVTDSSFSNVNDTLGTLSDSNTFGVSTIDSGYYWDASPNIITYSFNSAIPADYYESGDDLTLDWTALTNEQKLATRTIMQELDKIIETPVEEVSSAGDIRFNVISMSEETAAFAYQPGTQDSDGDVFLSQSFNTDSAGYGLNVGEFGWTTIAHELGHAMGLDHPFSEEGKISDILETEFDDINHTIMSYTDKDNSILLFFSSHGGLTYSQKFIYPDLYSLYDIAALQSMYGVNAATNTGDDVYTLKYTDYKIQTIWDAGGTDTIDLSSTTGESTIDLKSGSMNSADQYSFEKIVALQEALINIPLQNNFIDTSLQEIYSTDGLYTGKNNLGIAQGVIIENLFTGSGNDTVYDNEVNNILSTGEGNDSIYLLSGGAETINGGAGTDTLYINDTQSSTTLTPTAVGYAVVGTYFEATLVGIEQISYDGIVVTL